MAIKQYIPGATVGYPDSGRTQLQPLGQQNQQGNSFDSGTLSDAYNTYENISGAFSSGGLTNMSGEAATNMLGEPVSAVGGEMTGEAAGGLDLFGGFEGSGYTFGGESAVATTGGEGAAEGMAGGGWWALLAAAIIGNEREGVRQGYRDEDFEDYAPDLIFGKVSEQDFEKRWTPKMFGEDLENDDLGLGGDMLAGINFATGDFSNAWEYLKEDSSLSKIFDIF